MSTISTCPRPNSLPSFTKLNPTGPAPNTITFFPGSRRKSLNAPTISRQVQAMTASSGCISAGIAFCISKLSQQPCSGVARPSSCKTSKSFTTTYSLKPPQALFSPGVVKVAFNPPIALSPTLKFRTLLPTSITMPTFSWPKAIGNRSAPGKCPAISLLSVALHKATISVFTRAWYGVITGISISRISTTPGAVAITLFIFPFIFILIDLNPTDLYKHLSNARTSGRKQQLTLCISLHWRG